MQARNVFTESVHSLLNNRVCKLLYGDKGVFMEKLPMWITDLESTDIAFIKQFILASGSLKNVAKVYEISYPTVRNRLDQLIQKINASENHQDEGYIKLIRRLTIEEKIDFEAANLLISRYRETNY